MESWPNSIEQSNVENIEGAGDILGREGEAMVGVLESNKDKHPNLLSKAKRFASLALFTTGLTLGGREAEAGEVSVPAPAVGARTLEMKQKLENLGFETVKGGEVKTTESATVVTPTAPKAPEQQPTLVYGGTVFKETPGTETKKAEKPVNPVDQASKTVKTAEKTIRTVQSTISRLGKMSERIVKIGK